MSKRWASWRAVLALALGLIPGQLCAGVFDVKTFGAKGDGKTPDRDAINKAIEAAAAAGGGTVYFPAGTYVTGSIRLRSNLTLQFEPGSTLEASADPAAYDARGAQPVGQVSGFRAQPFPQQPDLGRGTRKRLDRRRRPD